MRSYLRIPLVLLAIVAVASCDRAKLESILGVQQTPHERYAASLRSAGLEHTALGRDWLAAADQSVRAPVDASLPFREEGFFPADEASAAGYRLTLRRGQRLVASLELDGARTATVYLDLFHVPRDTGATPDRVESSDSLSTSLEHEARRDGAYILRVQPELLRSVRYTLEIRVEPSLAFPVDGRDERAIRSFFGAARDGGQREHHGVDVFAPRGTPVLAAADGFVSSTRTNRLGGNVVWVWDPSRRQSLYYAHLDTQLVSGGERVRVGDTLGLVGNTGNARTTAPHLHFGVYVRGEGPVDPLPFVSQPRATAPRVAVDTGVLGGWVRSSRDAVPILPSPRAGDPALRIARNTTMRVLGAAADAYRVRLPDGVIGYVSARATEPTVRPGG